MIKIGKIKVKTTFGKSVCKAMIDKGVNLFDLEVQVAEKAKEKGYANLGTSRTSISRAFYASSPEPRLVECLHEVLGLSL